MARVSAKTQEMMKTLAGNASEPRKFDKGRIGLINGLNFYSGNFESKDSKIWALEWLETHDLMQAIRLKDAKDWQFSNLGFVCRMMTRGWEADAETIARVNTFFRTLVPEKEQAAESPVAPPPKKAPVKKHYINTSMCSLDDALELAQAGKESDKWTFSFSHTNKKDLEEVVAYCKRILKEMNDYREAYLLKTIYAIRPVLKQAQAEAETLLAHVEKTKHKVAVSAPKKINPTVMAKAVKYQREEKSLGLKSVLPSSIVGSKKCYVYDVAKRRLMLFVAVDARGLMFSGTTIKNFDPSKSLGKTIRKPDVFFAQFKNGVSLSAINKAYGDVAGKATPVLTGRTNETLMFLKASE